MARVLQSNGKVLSTKTGKTYSSFDEAKKDEQKSSSSSSKSTSTKSTPTSSQSSDTVTGTDGKQYKLGSAEYTNYLLGTKPGEAATTGGSSVKEPVQMPVVPQTPVPQPQTPQIPQANIPERPDSTIPENATGEEYEVQPGDTLSSIANSLGVPVSSISGYRSGNANVIFPGELLKVARGGQGATDSNQIDQDGLFNLQSQAEDLNKSLDLLKSKGYDLSDLSSLPPGVDIANLPNKNEDKALATASPLDDIFSKFGIPKPSEVSIEEVIKQVSKAYGIDSVQDDLEALDDKYADDVQNINDDPWLSEGIRVKKIQSLNDKYDIKRTQLVDRLRLQDDVVGRAIDVYYKERELQENNLNLALNLRQQEIENQLAIAEANKVTQKEDTGTPDIKEYNFAKTQGYSGSFLEYQRENANLKAKATGSGGSGGLTPAQINSTVNSIAGAFDNEPIVKEYNTINSYLSTFNSLGTSASDDQARIYAFAKVMDPNSVVRESEYKTVQQYSQALLKAAGINLARVFTATGALSPEARGAMSKTLQTKFNVQQGLYKQVESEYQRQINDAYSGKPRQLTNYGGTFSGSSKGSLSDNVFVEKSLSEKGVNYNQVISKTPTGQMPVLLNSSGEVGYIPVAEFNSAEYTRL